MADVVLYLIGISILSYGLGFMAGKRQASPERPMRLVSLHSYTAPGGLVANSFIDDDQWRMALTSFAFHANLIGSFSYRAMRRAAVCRRTAWERYSGILRESGVVAARPGSETTWTNGWCYSRLRVELKHGRIAPAYPPGKPPPLNSAVLAAHLAHSSTARTHNTP